MMGERKKAKKGAEGKDREYRIKERGGKGAKENIQTFLGRQGL